MDFKIAEPGMAGGPTQYPTRRVIVRRRVALFAIALLLCLGFVFGRSVASAGPIAAPISVTVHTVVHGDTLWGIARAVTPAGADIRDVMMEIASLNELVDGNLQPGQRVLLPA